MTNDSKLPADIHPEQLFTTQQLSALTGISRVTFEGWRSRRDKDGNLIGGGPKAMKLGPQIIRYRWADYLIWREQNNTTSAA